MKTTKRFILTLAAILGMTGAWAQDAEEVTVTKTANNNEWTLTMPASDVELQVEYETALALSETTDNANALTEWNGCEADVTLTRTLQAGSYNTFAVPFSMTIPSGWTVKELSSATFADGTLTLNFANAASIEAGKPYLVKVTANTDLSTAPFTGAIVSKDAQPFTSTYVDFVPTLGKTLVTGPEGDESNEDAVLFLAVGNKLVNPSVVNDPENAASFMKGFRAYFRLKGDAVNAASFNLDMGNGETDGIKSVQGSGFTVNGEAYNLSGQRVGKDYKGIVIVNGKKIVK